MNDLPPTTDFGFQEIPTTEKKSRVEAVFDTVANRYDLMNDLMSLGLHRYWKAYTVAASQIRPGHHILDVAGGTGDLAKKFAQKIGTQGKVVLADINANMLQQGRNKLLDAGYVNIQFVQADAENLPFPNNYFDRICISFGLRNVTHKLQALRSMQRILKPGGRLIVLEFSQPVLPILQNYYDRYSFTLLPKLGRWLTGSAESYQYLVESIRRHPNQETLKQMILDAEFDHCDYTNLTGGIVCLHRAIKI